MYYKHLDKSLFQIMGNENVCQAYVVVFEVEFWRITMEKTFFLPIINI